MINYLGWRGVPEARGLIQRHGAGRDGDALLGDANSPPGERIPGAVLPAERGDLPDRLGQPDRRGDPRPDPEMDQRRAVRRGGESPGKRLHLARRRPRLDATVQEPDAQRGPAAPVHGRQRPGVPDPPVLHRAAGIHQHRQEVRGARGLLRPARADRLPARKPRQVGGQERRACSSPAASSSRRRGGSRPSER